MGGGWLLPQTPPPQTAANSPPRKPRVMGKVPSDGERHTLNKRSHTMRTFKRHPGEYVHICSVRVRRRLPASRKQRFKKFHQSDCGPVKYEDENHRGDTCSALSPAACLRQPGHFAWRHTAVLSGLRGARRNGRVRSSKHPRSSSHTLWRSSIASWSAFLSTILDQERHVNPYAEPIGVRTWMRVCGSPL